MRNTMVWGVVLVIVNIASAAKVVNKDISPRRDLDTPEFPVNNTTFLRNHQCNSEGRFADPDDCGLFFDCLPNNNGGLVAHQQSCFGYSFHPTLKSCVNPQMVKDCTPAATRSISAADPKPQHLCNTSKNKYLCSDCKHLVMCIDGNSYTKPCESGTVCSIKNIFGGGVCYPGGAVECTCNKADVFQKDLYNPSKFLSCGNEGSDPIIHSCQEGMVFNEKRRICDTKIETTCTEQGTFAVKDDCTKYFTCIFTIEGWVRKELRCRDNTMYNEETDKCEDPCSWHNVNFICEGEGRFANPVDCTKYYECIADPLESDRFNRVEYDCPEGFEWTQMASSSVGHCLPAETTKEKCVKCKIPKEWCAPAVCSPSCINGECTGPNICNCTHGWTGNVCETPVCSSSCNNGECTGPNICNCTQGWTGNVCDTPVCSSSCVNGECTGPNICNCTQGWTGNVCETPVCSPSCINGECTGPNICNCSQGWIGNVCETHSRCPEGFFVANYTKQCFKLFNEELFNWEDAKAKCESEGLRLAEPEDDIAVTLRKDLIDTYGRYAWLGGRGDGSAIRWQSNGEVLSSSNPLWWPGYLAQHGTSTSQCLHILIEVAHMNSQPTHPYCTRTCTDIHRPLCELVDLV